MAARTEAKEATPAASEKTGPETKGPVAAAGKPRGGGLRAWIPALVVVVLAPAASWGVTQFVLLPTLQKKLLSPADADAAKPASEKADPSKGPVVPPTYEFKDLVVNLAGTMGTRYLKTAFLVTGSDPGLNKLFEENHAKMLDVTLNVLSSLTMADLEEPGSKNVLREKLVGAYNQALGKKVAEQVYFSDFVVQ